MNIDKLEWPQAHCGRDRRCPRQRWQCRQGPLSGPAGQDVYHRPIGYCLDLRPVPLLPDDRSMYEWYHGIRAISREGAAANNPRIARDGMAGNSVFKVAYRQTGPRVTIRPHFFGLYFMAEQSILCIAIWRMKWSPSKSAFKICTIRARKATEHSWPHWTKA